MAKVIWQRGELCLVLRMLHTHHHKKWFGFEALCWVYLCVQVPAYPKQKAKTLGCRGGGALGRVSLCCRVLPSVPRDLKQFSYKVLLRSWCAAGSPRRVGAAGHSHPGSQTKEWSRHSNTEGKVIQTAWRTVSNHCTIRYKTLWTFWKAVKLSWWTAMDLKSFALGFEVSCWQKEDLKNNL